MDKVSVSIRLLVFFEEPFWRGVVERIEDGKLSVCRITFGAEPKDREVYECILEHYYRFRFSPPVTAAKQDSGKANPKRMQREAQRETREHGIGTRSQQALQLQREQMKTERREENREQREAKKERLFNLKQEKRKEKHRGR